MCFNQNAMQALKQMVASLNASVSNEITERGTIEDLQNQILKLHAEAKTIQAVADKDNREMSDHEITEQKGLLDTVDKLTAEVARRERVLEQEARLSVPGARRTQPEDAPQVTNVAPQSRPEPRPMHEQARRIPATGGEASGLGRGAWGFRSFGEFAKVIRLAARGSMDPRLIANAAPSTFGAEGVGEDGGFAVPPDFRAEIVEKVMGEASLLGRTDAQVSSSNQLTIPKDETTPWQTSGGVQAYWESEGNVLRQSKLELQSNTVRLNKLTALVPVTDELLEDVGALSNYLRKKAPEKIDFKINDAIINGSGAGMPLGLMNSPALLTLGSGSQDAATFLFDNVVAMWSRMYAPCRQRSVWLINQDVEPQLLALAFPNLGAGTVVPVYLPPGGLSSQPYATLMGRPIIPTEACAELGTTGDVILADLSQYLSITKIGGIRQDVSIHLWFDYDMTAFRFIMRIGGMPWWTSPIIRAHGTNTLSCAVTMDTRNG